MPSEPSGSCSSSTSVTPTVCPASLFSIKTAENNCASSLLNRLKLSRGLFGCVAQGAFDLQVLVEPELAPLSTVAAVLVAAERRVHVESMVDRHPAGPDLAGHLTRLVEVGPRDKAGQAVIGVVGDVYGLIDVVIAEDAQHRPEDFLARDRHVIGDIRENGRLDVVTGVQPCRPARAAGDDGRALV